MSTLLHNACKEAKQGNDSLRKQVRFMGNKFLNATEICAQEAVYLALQLPLFKKTRQVVFINTSPPGKRVQLLKTRSSLETLPAESTDVVADNMIRRYSKRPKCIESYCLADYVSELEVVYPKGDFDESQDDLNEDDLKNENITSEKV